MEIGKVNVKSVAATPNRKSIKNLSLIKLSVTAKINNSVAAKIKMMSWKLRQERNFLKREQERLLKISVEKPTTYFATISSVNALSKEHLIIKKSNKKFLQKLGLLKIIPMGRENDYICLKRVTIAQAMAFEAEKLLASQNRALSKLHWPVLSKDF